jgi:hypothetical protein
MMVQCSSRLVTTLLIREVPVSILIPETDHPAKVFLASFSPVKERLGYLTITGHERFLQFAFEISHSKHVSFDAVILWSVWLEKYK